jgi:glycosyltransferase involved in cell wall biosynthesis
VAPNSTWIPRDLADLALKHCDLVSPSEWGRGILENYAPEERVSVWPHGVLPDFDPWSIAHEGNVLAYEGEGGFQVLHLASTPAQRKGTAELIEAWCRLVIAGKVGKLPLLDVVVSGPFGKFTSMLDGQYEAVKPNVRFFGRLNRSEREMAVYYHGYHLVCQPSRGEGFGLVPLEALCCGVPVAATCATGHLEYMRDASDDPLPGAVVIAHGAMEGIDDGPGARAPVVAADEIACGLVLAYEYWCSLHADALAGAEALRKEWSWENQAKKWLTEVGLNGLQKI